jgi:hypothetical protein
MKFFKRLSIFLILVLVITCATSYASKIEKLETLFYNQDFDAAVPEIRTLTEESDESDKLLYLMEAGTVLHTKGDYEASNKAFKQAEEKADTLKTSVSGESFAFLTNDTVTTFKGESFEKLIIKLYISLNHLMLGDLQNAKRYFKKLDYELRDMKVTEAKYKQNLFVRYLDAIVSEQLNSFNDARVSYRNIIEIDPSNKEILADRYVLALKEKDTSDQLKFFEGRKYLHSYNTSLQAVDYNSNMGEVVIINQAGKSAAKESRGKIIDEPMMKRTLADSIELSLRNYNSSEGAKVGLSVTTVMAMLSLAENPIPEYKAREIQKASPAEILINSKPITKTRVYNDYSQTAIANFNDNYSSLITKNIASIATKFAAAAITAYTAQKAAEEQFKDNKNGGGGLVGLVVGAATGIIAGYGISQTIKPDLRCWRTLPSNYQVSRIFLEPGTYSFEFRSNGKTVTGGKDYSNIQIEKGKTVFINIRSL